MDSEQVLGPRQITDLYLLALATSRGGRFVTFDDSIQLGAVRDAGEDSLLII
jgi:hypothetical protein